MAHIQFYLQSRKQRKVAWVRDDSNVGFCKKDTFLKKSVRLCVVVMQQLVLFSSKLVAKSSNIFTQSS
jgi:hypothetical protein